MDKDSAIYVTGQSTLLGSALLRELERQGYSNLVGDPTTEPDLTSAADTETFFDGTSPEYVFLTGGLSGGIQLNQSLPADLMRDNLLVDCNVIYSASVHGVKKLLYLASSCSYPKQCPQPMRTDSMLTGPLEPTNESYAVAKIAGIKMCQAYRQQYNARFIAAIPADCFGPEDDFNPENSHVIPALIRKMHEAKERDEEYVSIWGTGRSRREFILADQVASAAIFVMQEYEEMEPINLGGGSDLSIHEAALIIKEVVGYGGGFRFDTSKADGMPLKILDSSKLKAMGWQPTSSFRDGVSITYRWFLETRPDQTRLVSQEYSPRG